MRAEEQKTWNEVVDKHWWTRGHYAIIKDFIEAHLAGKRQNAPMRCLDAGCSGGHMTEFLGRYGASYGFDISFDGVAYVKKKGTVLQADASAIPFKDDVFDVAVLLDVAEHVEDDVSLLRELCRVCKTGAMVAVNVPAYMSLWGSHDEWNGHKRRYVASELRQKVVDAGFRVIRMTYLHPHLFLPLYIVRKLSGSRRGGEGEHDFKSSGAMVDSVLSATLALEKIVVGKVSFPFGTSLFCVMEKA